MVGLNNPALAQARWRGGGVLSSAFVTSPRATPKARKQKARIESRRDAVSLVWNRAFVQSDPGSPLCC
jgi:hypothetical protein